MFLICGLLPWNFLSAGLSAASGSVVANAGLIKKVYFSRAVLPAASVLSWTTNLLIELGILAIALMFFGHVVLIFLPLALIVVLLQVLFVLGMGLAMAALNVYFRDIEYLLSILLLMWFYSTPILYPISLVSDTLVAGWTIPVETLYSLNPMVHFTEAYRAIFYDLRVPSASTFGWMALSSGIAMTLGWVTFHRLQDRFAEEL